VLAQRHLIQTVGIDINSRGAVRSGGLRPFQNIAPVPNPRLGKFGLIAQRGPYALAPDIVGEIDDRLIARRPGDEQTIPVLRFNTRDRMQNAFGHGDGISRISSPARARTQFNANAA
jgi:hypothetical protein